MVRVVAAALGLVLLGCADPSVSLSFDIPAAYEERTRAVALRVLVPPTSEDYDCDLLAFGEVSEDTLAASTVEQVVVRDQHIDLRVPREGYKLFLFEALDAEGQLVAAACGELPTTDEHQVLDLVGEPATLVAAEDLNELGGVPLPQTVTVVVADVDAEPVEFADVRWSVVGPADVRTQGAGTTTDRGSYTFRPEAPDVPGPAALTVRTRWNRSQVPRFIGFGEPDVLFENLVPEDATTNLGRAEPESELVVGRIGPNGEMGLAALVLSATDGDDRQVLVAYWDGAAFIANTSAEIAGIKALSQVTRGGREHVVAISPAGWHEISGTAQISNFALPISLQPAERVAKMLPVAGCAEGDTGYELLLVATSESRFLLVDGNRQQVMAGPATALTEIDTTATGLLAAGCVEELGGDRHRTVVYREQDKEKLAFVALMDEVRTGAIPAASGSVGFARATSDSGARLLASELSLSGTALARYRLIPAAVGMALLETVAEDPSPAVPLSMAGGDVDGDGNGDVVAVIATASGRNRYRLLVSLGVELDDGNLIGLSEEDKIRNARVWLADFDDDGDDDVVVAGDTGVRVFQSGP